MIKSIFTTLIWLAMLTVPFWLKDDYLLSQLSIFGCYGLLAVSLSLIWGQVGLLCLGQAVFFGIGAYAMSLATLDMIPYVTPTGMIGQQWFGIIIAVIIPMIFAYLVAMLLFNGSQLDGAFLGLVTLALAVIVERFFDHLKYTGGANGLFGVPALTWQGEELSERAIYFVTLGIVMVIVASLYYLKSTSFGTLLKAIRENESRTNHLGVNTKHIKTQMFVLSAGIAGMAGGLFATQLFFVSPKLAGFSLSTEVLIWVAVGGRFSFTSAFLGAIIVRVLEDQLGDSFGEYWQLTLGFIFILVVLFFPRGLFGKLLK